jgi:hypothetical protein
MDEKILRAHLEDGPFQLGLDQNKWRLIEIRWPQVFISVRAGKREGGPDEFVFCFECQNYPQNPITGRLWDCEKNEPLDFTKWPNGKSRIPSVFRPDWKNGECLYLPCDRKSIEGHTDWPAMYPFLIWKSDSDICLYLGELYELLNSNDYSGIRCS